VTEYALGVAGPAGLGIWPCRAAPPVAYRRQSILLMVPLVPLVVAALQGWRNRVRQPFPEDR
jgi:hypothetical protein